MSELKRKKEEDYEGEEGGEEKEIDFSKEIVNVDFDFRDPAEIDFHAIKNLLRSLFDADADTFDLSTIADMVLDTKKHYGTTIKVDDGEQEKSDPYALFSVLDLSGNKDKPAVKALIDYYVKKTGKKPEFTRKLRQLFASGAKETVGLLITEKFINMPVELTPPLYHLYNQHVEETGGQEYDYYLVVSKTFTEEESELDKEEKRPTKRNKFQNPKEFYYFHPEDEVIHKTCEFDISFPYTKEVVSDSKRAFQNYGIYPHGHVMLLPGSALGQTVKNLEEAYSQPAE